MIKIQKLHFNQGGKRGLKHEALPRDGSGCPEREGGLEGDELFLTLPVKGNAERALTQSVIKKQIALPW